MWLLIISMVAFGRVLLQIGHVAISWGEVFTSWLEVFIEDWVTFWEFESDSDSAIALLNSSSSSYKGVLCIEKIGEEGCWGKVQRGVSLL